MATDPASILVLAQRTDRPFNSPAALAELLRLEGINDVALAWLEEMNPALLEGRSLVLLGPSDPAREAVEALVAHVEAGGGLICSMPGEALAARLGLEPRNQGWRHPRIGAAFDDMPPRGLPICGWGQAYQPAAGADAVEIAPLLTPDGRGCGAPGIVQLRRGKGTIVALAYDLATTVYLLRQGDPLLAGCRNSGVHRMRAADLFADSWNADDARFPVADLHCHLLRELVHRAWPADTVLPWLWYFPDGAASLLVLTSDDDWSTPQQWEALLGACDENGASATFYVVCGQGGHGESAMERRWMEELIARGYDFSIHPDLPPPTRPTWRAKLEAHIEQFRGRYGREPSQSVRNHCISWSGYLDGARVEAELGFAIDANYFALPPKASLFMGGSGFPMPFVAPAGGEVLPIAQLQCQFSDETTLKTDFSQRFSLNLDPEPAIELVTGMLSRGAGSTASMMCVNSHPVSFGKYSHVLWRPVLRYARQQGLPVWNVERFWGFWQARRGVVLKPVRRGEAVKVPGAGVPGLNVMVPAERATGSGIGNVLGRTYALQRLG